MKTIAAISCRLHLFLVASVVMATAIVGSSTTRAQTPPPPTHTFQPAGSSGTFGTNTNWSLNTLPVAGSQVLIADGKTATMSQGNADTLFGSLTLGTNSVISLSASNTAGLVVGSVLYFNNGSQLNYTAGGTNRANTYNIVSGATVGMHLGQTGSDSLPQGSMVGGSNTVVNMTAANLLNMRLNAGSFSGTLNHRTNVANNARAVNYGNANNSLGSGITNIDTFVRVTGSKSNLINDSGTLQLTGSSGGASNVKFAMGGSTDTIGNFVIDTPIGATASAPTLQGSATAFTVSGTTTFQGTAGAVNFDSSNASPSSHNLITTGNMTFGGTGTWAVSGDGRIQLNAASGTRTITTNTNASIANVLTGTQGFTKAGTSSLTLTGTNTYTGATNVNAGTLVVNGSLAAGSAVSVGASGTLGGTGTINGATTILGAHTPGTSPGIQTFASDLTYSGGSSTVQWELVENTTTNPPNPNADYDQIIVGGNLDFSGATALSVVFDGVGSNVLWANTFWDTDQQWTLYDVTGSTANFGNLSLAAGSYLDSASNTLASARPSASFSISQSGSDVLISYIAVPEPATIAILGSVVGLLGLNVARRRKV